MEKISTKLPYLLEKTQLIITNDVEAVIGNKRLISYYMKRKEIIDI